MKNRPNKIKGENDNGSSKRSENVSDLPSDSKNEEYLQE